MFTDSAWEYALRAEVMDVDEATLIAELYFAPPGLENRSATVAVAVATGRVAADVATLTKNMC